jgi:hypothetical protein
MARSRVKPTLPITREQFRTAAKPVTVVINGKELTAPRKEFSTGSLGWYLNDKMTIEVDGQPVTVQIGLNLTIVGSKELPLDASSPAAPPAPATAPPAAAPPPAGPDAAGQAQF